MGFYFFSLSMPRGGHASSDAEQAKAYCHLSVQGRTRGCRYRAQGWVNVLVHLVSWCIVWEYLVCGDYVRFMRIDRQLFWVLFFSCFGDAILNVRHNRTEAGSPPTRCAAASHAAI